MLEDQDQEGNEMFSLGLDGKKQDAHLHAEMLADADHEADDAQTEALLRGMGFSEKAIQNWTAQAKKNREAGTH